MGSGQLENLGDGTTDYHTLPIEITTPDGGGFTFISSSLAHTLGLGADGKAYAWGSNNQGRLGNGSSSAVVPPLPVEIVLPAGVTRFEQLEAGAQTSYGIGDDGNAYSWGDSGIAGYLGDGTQTNRNTPGPITTPVGVSFTQISASNQGVMALGSDHQVYVWGANLKGQLGNNTSGAGAFSTVPIPVPTLAGIEFVQVHSGNEASYALASDGTLYAWGSNAGGQLGDGTSTDRLEPVTVTPPAPGVTFTEIISGGLSSPAIHAIGSDGVLYGWGNNAFGSVGDGTTTDRFTPVPVDMPTGVVFSSYSSFAGGVLALEPDGTPWYWGTQLLDLSTPGVTEPSPTKLFPVVVTGVTFDGVAGTNLVDNGDGTFDVDTPALPSPGQVDVVVSWTLNGVAQTPISYLASADEGFTYYAPAAPVIADPSDVTVTEGDPAVFTVPAPTGAPAPTVTWEMFDGTDWVPVTGGTVSADGLTLTVASTTLADTGRQFRAVATNSEGSDTSAAATLTVNPTPVTPTVTNPTDQTTVPGTAATFAVTVTGTPAPTVVWEFSTDGGTTWQSVLFDPTAVVAADGLSVTVTPTSVTQSGHQYRATATNSAGTVTSNAGTLTVNPATGGGGTPGTGTTPSVDKSLQVTGGDAPMGLVVLGALALLLGGGTLAANRIAKRRVS